MLDKGGFGTGPGHLTGPTGRPACSSLNHAARPTPSVREAAHPGRALALRAPLQARPGQVRVRRRGDGGPGGKSVTRFWFPLESRLQTVAPLQALPRHIRHGCSKHSGALARIAGRTNIEYHSVPLGTLIMLCAGIGGVPSLWETPLPMSFT